MSGPEAASQLVEDHRWMRRALAVAEKSLYLSNPNPRVGCVLVRDGRWLAEGNTQEAGGRHAEAQALWLAQQQQLDVRGSTAYVTLEPCSHQGRTPPCADALIAAGIRRVVVALQDPNPRVAGQGIERLRAAGLDVDAGLMADDSLAQNPGFCARMTRGTPWLWLKSAASFDGHTALPDGRSQWITGDAARADGHGWRARACVVLTGIGTVLTDNPLLDVRAVQTPRQPIRAVLDTQFIISEQARLFNGDPVWIFTARADAGKAARLAGRNVRVIVLPLGENGALDLNALLCWLGDHEINEVHVEAGARLQGALVAGGHVDEWVAYVAPSIVGDGQGLAALPAPIPSLDQAYRYEFLDAVQLGADMRLRMRHAGRWQALRAACGLPARTLG
ncbi:bifunctional diaminohydroxyphosphoribosylaminopyrimidine deaminase/5-amino-6-(5-phosphoribosylamino)uracil reductase RibD [uncultured Castellaniella sp.]|uniref:bifunctional diaminohydroxyphosphoribosylaminopyrimidine deaminase/5-amino-6-(5-phosphoribosylamino)uracil reductase RibD n=1 Tax=uncultured Castellaniella sp. TaxID=647907 RepID=UPI0026134D88|nr:bifunctional diaminohydroxyphosphoribosylaminopyrimidine deaminase/5-amino-6-(5-phosphoribosylamino)uracil reductase RibD [uncultured Castellaniella sp.]